MKASSLVRPAIALLLAILGSAVFLHIRSHPAGLGSLPLWQRGLFVDLGVLLLMSASLPLVTGVRLRRVVRVILLFSLLPAPLYFQWLLPRQSGEGVEAEQLKSALITESTSNGIIEVGFAYPIYTPTISIHNRGLFTAAYDVYLRMYDANGDSSLFRAVRQRLPDSGLTVEATVNGMLSKSVGYLFNPVTVAALGETSGQVVFIISNLRDGTSFNDALNSAYPAEFELRDPETDELLLRFPLTRI